MKNNILALVAAVVGGIAGYLCFFWIVRQGFYALILPGGLIGLAASMFKPKAIWVSVVCGAFALFLGLYTEWKFAPFVKDASLPYFLTHVHQLKPLTLIMIAIGTVIGFLIPLRSRPEQSPPG